MRYALTELDDSAFDMLRHRNVPIQSLLNVLPDLASVHPHILTRVETDGTPALAFSCLAR